MTWRVARWNRVSAHLSFLDEQHRQRVLTAGTVRDKRWVTRTAPAAAQVTSSVAEMQSTRQRLPALLLAVRTLGRTGDSRDCLAAMACYFFGFLAFFTIAFVADRLAAMALACQQLATTLSARLWLGIVFAHDLER